MKVSKVVLRHLISLILLYTFLRVFYFVYNYSEYTHLPASELLWSFLHGLRFDLSAIAILYAPVWLYLYGRMFVADKNWVRYSDITLTVFFIAVNFIFICINIADAEWIHFNGQRATLGGFAIKQDIQNQLPQLVIHYWNLTAVAILLAVFLVFAFTPLQKVQKDKYGFNLKLHPAILFFALLMTALTVRGGLQNKPLRPAQAFVYEAPQLGQMVLNSTFTILHTSRAKSESRVHWLNAVELESAFDGVCAKSNVKPLPENTNVMVIILESFAAEYIGFNNDGKGYTPYFDKLAGKSLYFLEAYANGRRSIEAIPSVLAALPSLLQDSFLTSSYQAIRILQLPRFLKKQGYQSAFFHAAENGSMFFDSFAARIGFDDYFGLRQYPDLDRDYDGTWGIYDEPFFLFTKAHLDQIKKPFFATLFSISSHQPYSVPKEFAGRFPKGELEIHESIGYTDYALEKFFTEAEKEPWFENTLFVITADHTSKSLKADYQTQTGVYRVPILFYHPKYNLQNAISEGQMLKPVQHSDIMPSILELLNLPDAPKVFTGCSVFSNTHPGVINRSGHKFWFRSKKLYAEVALSGELKVQRLSERPVGVLQFESNKVLSESDLSEGEQNEVRYLRAYVQRFLSGVIDDRLL